MRRNGVFAVYVVPDVGTSKLKSGGLSVTTRR
jgi:hypothetical protein